MCLLCDPPCTRFVVGHAILLNLAFLEFGTQLATMLVFIRVTSCQVLDQQSQTQLILYSQHYYKAIIQKGY